MILKINAEEMNNPQDNIWHDNIESYKKNSDIPNIEYITSNFYLAKTKQLRNAVDVDSYNTGVIQVRTMFAGFKGKVLPSKYVFLQSYYDRGDLSTIDVVALPVEQRHKIIIYSYINDILTPLLNQQFSEMKRDELLSRFLSVGGTIAPKENGIEFSGQSQDLSNKLGGYDSNSIAAYLLSESGLFGNVLPADLNPGKEYIEKCLDMMAQNKLTNDFYDKLIDMYILEPIRQNSAATAQIIGALTQIKAFDRALYENKDATQMFAEELSGGISRDILAKSVAEKVKINQKNEREVQIKNKYIFDPGSKSF